MSHVRVRSETPLRACIAHRSGDMGAGPAQTATLKSVKSHSSKAFVRVVHLSISRSVCLSIHISIYLSMNITKEHRRNGKVPQLRSAAIGSASNRSDIAAICKDGPECSRRRHRRRRRRAAAGRP
jgi:hypothetical protein